MTTASPADAATTDCLPFQVRALRPSDANALLTLHANLSDESLRFRFFGYTKAPERETERLLECIGSGDVALVAVAEGHIVGVASYVRTDKSPGCAEVSFVVADRMHGHGVGTRLLERLAEDGRARGLRSFEAYVLGDNVRMLRMLEDSGFVTTKQFDCGTFHVWLALQPSARQ